MTRPGENDVGGDSYWSAGVDRGAKSDLGVGGDLAHDGPLGAGRDRGAKSDLGVGGDLARDGPLGAGRDVGGGGPLGADGDLAGDVARTALTMARRFAAGATMWCVSEPWPAHGRHVAVEFVHPVIVGKRALPAVSMDTADPIGALRLLARPGDILLALSPADHGPTTRLLRHAEAWGLTRVWLGAGPPPVSVPAEHVVWAQHPNPGVAARSGHLVMLYHLLWELTHVVFEHPGLLDEPAGCDGEVCITCSDQAEVAEVAAVDGTGTAEVVVGGRRATVDVSLVDAVAAGDLVLLHAGVAVGSVEDSSTDSSGSVDDGSAKGGGRW